MSLRCADVLLAVAEAAGPGAVDGGAVLAVLEGRRIGPARADRVLARLLELEAGGLVEVGRAGGLRFGLTSAGERAVGRLGGGRTVAVSLAMVDLVGYVAFTDEHGDADAHRAALDLATRSRQVLGAVGGRVVKTSGDGLIAAAGPEVDLVPVVRSIAAASRQPDGTRWPVRASVHVGTPIEHDGDLFGRDVNLLARLCDAAAPDEVVASAPPGTTGRHGVEQLVVRGLPAPVLVRRWALS